MKPAELTVFVDPATGAPMHLEGIVTDSATGAVQTGTISTPDGRIRYDIVGGIPRFAPRDNYTANFGLQWQRHVKTQLDSCTGSTYSRDRLFGVTAWPKDLRGQCILEAGSGAGRFTEVILQTGAELWTFDYSDAVVANLSNNGKADNIRLFQGDIYNIPLPKKSFDKVICLGVIQHTPDVKKTVMSLASMVKPGGELVIDFYVKRLMTLMHWKYALRPIAIRMKPATLYKFTNWYAPRLIPLARLARKLGGRAGLRLVPILDQSDKSQVSREVQRDWTILDTYDALGARYDQPQTVETLRKWLTEAGMKNIVADEHPVFGAYARGTAS